MFRYAILVALLFLGTCSASATTETEDICSVCELAVTFAENVMSSNSTEAEVETFLENFCSILPTKYSELCSNFVENYFVDVVNAILQKETPSQVCSLIAQCSNNTVVATVGSSPCSLCEFVAGALENFVTENTTETQIENFLEKLCDLLPASDAAECASFVEAYLPDIVYDIDSNESPSVLCTQINLCSSSAVARTAPYKETFTSALDRAQAGNEGGDACSLCELVVSGLENYLEENTTQTEVEAFLTKLCALLPANDAQICTSVVDAYLPEVIYDIENTQSPSEVCSTELKLCSSDRLPKVAPVTKAPSAKSLKVAAMKQAPKPDNLGDDCSLCEFVASALENFVSENTTQTEVEDFLDNICALLPSNDATLCDTLVQTYLPVVLYDIVNDETPDVICSDIGLCSSKVITSSDGSDCSLCELVASALENFITQNTTETEVEDFLDNLCNLLPAGDASQCNYLVATYLPELIYDVTNNEAPTVVCSQIGLCNSSRAMMHMIVEPVVPTTTVSEGGDLCSLCQLAVGALETFVTDSTTEGDIETFLGDVCDILPGNIGPDCTNFVDNELPAILNNIVNNEDPSKLCSAIALCTSESPRMTIN